ncbi:protein IQ-DOMAIN 19-like [Actinidia eriantha]|uniref:protein IQ-DOMAIN 19-like n=1 Tax=Actinidia eriantha TaxID=165200 RepID=UPI002584A831|nr:protein IQ-DOMAIN 19-like [Actinidia eriantha]
MGKASKWIRNLLMGKREDKNKKETTSFSAESLAILAATDPKEKRRWSFGRSSNVDISCNKSRSFESIVTIQPETKVIAEFESKQNHATVKPVAGHKTTKTIIQAKLAAIVTGPLENAAATKIQAIFRSYLARRALIALRGLVKLQALVRGYLVRKRAGATLRCMHALISIQVRARVQRLQMAEEAQPIHTKRTATRTELVLYNQHRKPINTTEPRDAKIQRIEREVATPYPRRLSISNRENQLQMFPNRSALADMSSRNSDQFDKYSLTPLSQRSSRHNSPISKSPLPEYAGHLLQHYPWLPSYMSNTESSRAKERSPSEPKQRPKSGVKKKVRRSMSSDRIDLTQEIRVRPSTQKYQHPWLMKLYRSTTKAVKDSDYDSVSATTNNSNFKSLISNEPPVNLY